MIKLCDEHQEILVASVVQRGLGHLIADNQAVSSARSQDFQLRGWTKDNFCPVYFAALAIITNSINHGVNTSEGDVCPICHGDDERSDWLDFAADDAREHAIVLGLVKSELSEVPKGLN